MLLCQLRTWVGSNMPCLLDSSRSCTELFAHFSGEEILGYLNRWFVINSSAHTSLSFYYLVLSNGAAKKTFGPFNGWEQFCSASISWGCCMAEMIRWHVFSSWWLAQHISFHSPQQCMEVPSVLHPEHSILFLCYFLSFSHLGFVLFLFVFHCWLVRDNTFIYVMIFVFSYLDILVLILLLFFQLDCLCFYVN